MTPALYKLRGVEFKPRPMYNPPIEIPDTPPAAASNKRDRKAAKDQHFVWCEYPPKVRTHLTKLARLKDNDVVSLFQGLQCVSNILPGPISKQMPPWAFCVRGEMSSERRLTHTPQSYMATGEMEMMTALLVNDGRYDDSVFFVPYTYVEHIWEAAAAYAEYENACVELDKVLHPRQGDRRDSAIKQGCKGELQSVIDAFTKCYDRETKRLVQDAKTELHYDAKSENSNSKLTFIIQKLLMPNPSMLEKKLLVMPKCAKKHWSAVFIFNASFVDLAGTRKKESDEFMQPCFFPLLFNLPRRHSISSNNRWRDVVSELSL